MADAFPKNLVEFVRKFATVEACVEYLTAVRWPEGFVCPACGAGKGWTTSRANVYCRSCDRQTSLTAGTVLHGTHVDPRSWFLAMWLVCTQKTGLSAVGLQRELGLGSYRTAWLMLQKLRQAMVRIGREKLRGSLEVDETYIGGEEKGVPGRKLVGKALVAVAVELDGRKVGRVRLRHVPDGSGKSLVGFVRDCAEKGASVHTDGWSGYNGLWKAGFRHRATHTAGDDELAVEVFPHVHLAASLLKRWLGATHQGRVSHKHLQGYLDEFTFRFNRRTSRSRGMLFFRVLELAVGHEPVRYRALVAGRRPRRRESAPPRTRGHPPSLERPAANRPWRGI
jgi:transposase-like protein